jgi:hypothetical protein
MRSACECIFVSYILFRRSFIPIKNLLGGDFSKSNSSTIAALSSQKFGAISEFMLAELYCVYIGARNDAPKNSLDSFK